MTTVPISIYFRKNFRCGTFNVSKINRVLLYRVLMEMYGYLVELVVIRSWYICMRYYVGVKNLIKHIRSTACNHAWKQMLLLRFSCCRLTQMHWQLNVHNSFVSRAHVNCMKFVKLSKHLLVNTSRFSANAGNKNHVVRSARVHSPAYVNIRIQAQDHAHAHVSFARVLSRLILYLLPRNKNTKAYGTRVHTHTHRERERKGERKGARAMPTENEMDE